MGIEIWSNKEEAEEDARKLNKREEEQLGESNKLFIMKVEVVNPKLFRDGCGGKWCGKKRVDENWKVFHKGDVGYLVIHKNDPHNVTEWGLKEI